MAKAQKQKEAVAGIATPVVKEEQAADPAAVEEKTASDELSFLESLLDTQVRGNWHGPAASLLKERIAKIKAK